MKWNYLKQRKYGFSVVSFMIAIKQFTIEHWNFSLELAWFGGSWKLVFAREWICDRIFVACQGLFYSVFPHCVCLDFGSLRQAMNLHSRTIADVQPAGCSERCAVKDLCSVQYIWVVLVCFQEQCRTIHYIELPSKQITKYNDGNIIMFADL